MELDKVLTFMEEVNVSDVNYEQLLLCFEKIFGYSQSIFWLSDNNYHLSPVCHLNVEEKATNEYIKFYQKLDDFWHPRSISPLTQQKHVFKVLDIIPEERYEQTSIYREFLVRYQHHHLMTIYFFQDQHNFSFITFTREKSDRPFDHTDSLYMELISRFLNYRICNDSKLSEDVFDEKLKRLSFETLTTKEKAVLDLVQKGLTNMEISKLMYISINTVKTHLLSIYRKLDVSNRTELCYKINQ